MATSLDQLLTRHHVLVATDNAFQKRARLLQALWREEQGLAVGEHQGHPLGSRLAMPSAKETLANFLTETIRSVVRKEVLDPERSRGKLYGQPRIFNDLLSSQPLCFNLFGELQRDLALASRALRRLTSGRIARVTAIGFEHSPGPRDPKYTGDRSAFDVLVAYTTSRGARCFAGIEVKYHEALNDEPALHRDRYDKIAAAMGCFAPGAAERLKKKPLQQIWRDHLLAGSLLPGVTGDYEDGFFAFLHPKDNAPCVGAVEDYRGCLSDEATFVPWMLESFVAAVKAEGGGAWVDSFASRYLAFDKVDARLAG
jgi:PD-(D/E)XK nuclease superfamily protein